MWENRDCQNKNASRASKWSLCYWFFDLWGVTPVPQLPWQGWPEGPALPLVNSQWQDEGRQGASAERSFTIFGGLASWHSDVTWSFGKVMVTPSRFSSVHVPHFHSKAHNFIHHSVVSRANKGEVLSAKRRSRSNLLHNSLNAGIATQSCPYTFSRAQSLQIIKKLRPSGSSWGLGHSLLPTPMWGTVLFCFPWICLDSDCKLAFPSDKVGWQGARQITYCCW